MYEYFIVILNSEKLEITLLSRRETGESWQMGMVDLVQLLKTLCG